MEACVTANPETSPDAADERVYVVYDARARYAVSEASVIDSCATLQEAKASAERFGQEAVIISYRIEHDITSDERREN